MIVEPKIMNGICLTCHPVGLEKVAETQIEWAKKQPKIDMPKRVLVVGGSTGYGLSTRAAAAFAGGADTLCVSFEKEPSAKRPGTPGFYNNRAFDKLAKESGLKSESINADAFSHETRKIVIDKIKEMFDGGQIDLLVYSLASPVRPDPETGTLYKSVLKPLGKTYSSKTVNFQKKTVFDVTIEPGSDEEVNNTVKVMGGEDWTLWMDALSEGGVLAEGIKTCAYSYIGPELTYPVYRGGTIGKAKEHLEATAKDIQSKYSSMKAEAFVAVNKAIVSRSSSVIPVVPLYIGLLFKVMKEKGIHEGCPEQMYRMLADKVYGTNGVVRDESGLVRMDDWEMREDVQSEVAELWEKVNEDNLLELSDLEGFTQDYMELHGFAVDGVDYSAEIDPSL